MRSFLVSLAALCAVSLGAAACGPDTVAVLVHVKNLPPDLAALQVSAHLDCKPAQQGTEFTQNFEQFAITVPKSAISGGRLVIEVSAVDGDRCALARGRVDTAVSPDARQTEAETSLVPLAKPLCTLTVEQSGDGTITPSAGGVVHGPAPDARCGFPAPTDCRFPGSCDFLKGQPVTLTSSRDGSAFVTTWGNSPSAQAYAPSGKHEFVLNKAATVRVRLSDGFCSPDSWCWSSFSPQGNTLTAVWARTPADVWTVGYAGTILHWDGTAWTPHDSGTTEDLNAVWGSDANSVWAVGNKGSLLYWNGERWLPQGSGTTQPLFSVWGLGSKNVWIVGFGGFVRQWNGTVWTTQSSGTSDGLNSIWGTDPNNVWAVGGQTILKWNGTSWSRQPTGISGTSKGNFSKVLGSSDTSVWALYDGSTLFYWDGMNWSSRTGWGSSSLRDFWIASPNEIIFVGIEDIVKWDGNSWSKQTNPTKLALLGIWGSSSNDIWAVGENGVILRRDSTQWKLVSRDLGKSNFWGVWGTAPSDLWVVGDSTMAYHRTGHVWSGVPSNAGRKLSSIWGSDKDHVWAVGDYGAIVKWDGSTWTSQYSNPERAFSGVWGIDANNVWAVGQGASPGPKRFILKSSDGQVWNVQDDSTKGTAWGIWGSDKDNVWLFGQVGVADTGGSTAAAPNISKWNGSVWSPVSNLIGRNLFSAWGTDAEHIWVGTDIGQVAHWDGATWTAQPTGATQVLYGVWGADASNVWAAGLGGVIARWNGTDWSLQRSGTTQVLQKLWGTSANNVWAVGFYGTILRYQPLAASD